MSQTQDTNRVLGQQFLPVVDSSAPQIIVIDSGRQTSTNVPLSVDDGNGGDSKLQLLTDNEVNQPLTQSRSSPGIIQNTTLLDAVSNGSDLNINASSDRRLDILQ